MVFWIRRVRRGLVAHKTAAHDEIRADRQTAARRIEPLLNPDLAAAGFDRRGECRPDRCRVLPARAGARAVRRDVEYRRLIRCRRETKCRARNKRRARDCRPDRSSVHVLLLSESPFPGSCRHYSEFACGMTIHFQAKKYHLFGKAAAGFPFRRASVSDTLKRVVTTD